MRIFIDILIIRWFLECRIVFEDKSNKKCILTAQFLVLYKVNSGTYS